MGLNLRTYRILLGIIFAGIASLVFTAIPAHAETYLSGTYRCATMEVAGKAEPCHAPSLELKADGSYKMLSETGTYEIVAGHWLVLSASKHHGKARLDSSKKIVFEFVSGGKKHRIIYRQKYKRPSGWVAS
jgi:hypothetical protein